MIDPESRREYRTGGTSGTNYRPEIDGLRAVAVLAVIANHFNEDILASGYLGVDVFFVISGYVITLSLSSKQSTTLWAFTGDFFKRRIKRLAPALFTCVTVTALLLCIFNYQTASHINTGIASLFGISNIYLHHLSTNYFADSTKLNPFTQTWSLGIEEQFYLIFPWLAWLTWLKKKPEKSRSSLFAMINLLATSASLLFYILLYPKDPSAAYFLLPTRLWELTAGSLAFLWQPYGGFLGKKQLRLVQNLILPLLIALFALRDVNQQALTITCVLITYIIISEPTTSKAHALLQSSPLIKIGLASYSLYLWHWSVLTISRWTIGIHWWSVPIQLFLIIALGFASYELIEKQTRHINWNVGKPAFFAIYVLSIGTLSSILSLAGRPYSKLFSGRQDCIPLRLTTCKPKSEPHTSLTPFITNTTITPENCIIATEKKGFPEEIIKNCSITSRPEKAGKRIFLVGDSLAGNLSPILDSLYLRRGFSATILTKYACRFEIDLNYRAPTDTPRPSCSLANSQRLKHLSNTAKDGDIILIAAMDLIPTPRLISTYEKIHELLGNKQVAIIATTPVPLRVFPEDSDAEIQRCINSSSQWFNYLSRDECRKMHSISREEYLKQAGLFTQSIRKIEAKNPNFHVWDISKILCNEKSCPSHLNGTRLYQDTKHLSSPITTTLLLQDFERLLESKIKLNIPPIL